ncbi:unnamed protein product [Leptosia nina]|uniref:Spindle assembly abnormal protein 6 N-terminal domain-containing protein n=1 Tax=Leptosia nina TaxID=320188 RepID=A0AAV1JNK4_9NEOP
MPSKTFHKGKYYISFKRGFEESKKDISICVDKVFDSDSLRLTLSNDEDPTFLCRILISRCDYEELKKQQGLLIDFDNFPSQVVRLLQQCTANNMFLILHQINHSDYNFEVVEHNEFKRLVHLSLKTGPANDNDVKQHMAETIAELKKTLSALKSSATSNETLWNDRCAKMEVKIQELTRSVSKMEEDKLRRESEYLESLRQEKDRLAQEKLQLQKAADINAKNLIASSQENLSKKDKQIDELNYTCRHLKESISQMERQINEKNQRTSYLEKEVQRFHLELSTQSAKNVALEREITERDRQIHQLTVKTTSLEKTVKDDADVIKEFKESIQTLTMEKDSLERRLSLSESLANRNNEAAQSTAEQLLKANQIISKQNSDLIEMKDKLLCRTAIALEQEKVIERNTKEIQDLNSQIQNCTEQLEKRREEVEMLKEKCELNEVTIRDRDETIKNNNMVVQWLHKKLEETGSRAPIDRNHCIKVASSTPHLPDRHPNSSLMHESEESINFYGMSKSSLEDSPNVYPKERIAKGLDPKYLKPVSEDLNANKKDSSKVKSATSHSTKGKENKNIELPKVDYREKRPSKPSTPASYLLSGLLIILSCVCVLSKKYKDEEKPVWAKKDIRDFTDADMERLLDQWDEDEEPLPEDELPEHLRKPPAIDMAQLDMSNPEAVLQQTKKGQTLMMFVTVANRPPRARTEELTKIWQTGLWSNHIQAERYLIDDDRAIFMFKDGSQAWTAKEYLLEQNELKNVQLESQTYDGKYPDVKNTAVRDEL